MLTTNVASVEHAAFLEQHDVTLRGCSFYQSVHGQHASQEHKWREYLLSSDRLMLHVLGYDEDFAFMQSDIFLLFVLAHFDHKVTLLHHHQFRVREEQHSPRHVGVP